MEHGKRVLMEKQKRERCELRTVNRAEKEREREREREREEAQSGGSDSERGTKGNENSSEGERVRGVRS